MKRAVRSCCIITAECTIANTGTSYLDHQKKKKGRRKDLQAIRKWMRSRPWALPGPVESELCITQKAAAAAVSGTLKCSNASTRPQPRPFSSGGAVLLVDLGVGDWGRRKYEDMTSGRIKEEVEPGDKNGYYRHDHDEPLPSRTKLTLGLFSKITKGRPPEEKEEEAAGNIVELMQDQEPTGTRTALGEGVDNHREDDDHHQQPHRLHLRRSRSRSGIVVALVATAAAVTGDICAGESDLTSAENHNGSGRLDLEELESSRSSNNNTDGSSIFLESAAESVVSRSSISNNNINNNSELESSAVPVSQRWRRMHEKPPLLSHDQLGIYTTANGVAGAAGGRGIGDSSEGWGLTKQPMNDGFLRMNNRSNQGMQAMRVEDMNHTRDPDSDCLTGAKTVNGGRGSDHELLFESLTAQDRELPFSMQSARAVTPSDRLLPNKGPNAKSEDSWLQLGVGPSQNSSSAAAAASLSFYSSSAHHVGQTDGDPHDHDRPWSGQQQGHAHAHERKFSRQERPSSTSTTSMGISFPIAGRNYNLQRESLATDMMTVKSSQTIMPAAVAADEQWHQAHRRDFSIIPSEYGKSTTSCTGVRCDPSITNFTPATLRRLPIAVANADGGGGAGGAAAASISTRDHAGASGSSTVHFPTFNANVGQASIFMSGGGGGGIPMNAVGSGPGGATAGADAYGQQQAFGPGRVTSGGSASVIRTSSLSNISGKDAAVGLSSQRDAVDEDRFYDTRSQIPTVFPSARNAEFPNASSSTLGRYGSTYNNRDGPAVPSTKFSSAATTSTGGGVHGQFSRLEDGYGRSSSAVGRSMDVNNNNLNFQADGQPCSLASLLQTRDGELLEGTTGSGVAARHPWHWSSAFEAGRGLVPKSRLIPLGKNFQGWTSNAIANTSVPSSDADLTSASIQSHIRADDGSVSIAIDAPQGIKASDESWGSYFRKVSPHIMFQSSINSVPGQDHEPHAHAQLHPSSDEGTVFQSTSFSHHHDRDERSLAALPVSREGGPGGDHENLGVWKQAIKHIRSRPAWPPAETLNLGPVAWPSSGTGLRGDSKLESTFDASRSEPPFISPFHSEPAFTARGDSVHLGAIPPKRQTWQQQQQQVQKQTRPHYSSASANAPHKQTPLTFEKEKIRLLSPAKGDSTSPESHHAPGLWFILQSAESQIEEGGLPQVSKAYLRIKDGKMPVSAVKKYLVTKLGLTSESEIEITCKGQPVVPNLPLQHVRDVIWFSNLTASSSKAAAAQTLASSHSSEDHDYDQDGDEESRTMLPAAGAPNHESERQHQPGSMLSTELDGADSASAAAAAATATIISNDILMVLTYRRHSRDRTLPLTPFLT